jgi:hypothetical protein
MNNNTNLKKKRNICTVNRHAVVIERLDVWEFIYQLLTYNNGLKKL